jgi:hypothetical protein
MCKRVSEILINKKTGGNVIMMFKAFLNSLTALALFLLLVMPFTVYAEEEAESGPVRIEQIVKKAMGRKVEILRQEKAEPSPVSGWTQTRVWISSVYGETPVLFYASEDGRFFLAGSIYDASGENLTKRDVGKTIPKVIDGDVVEFNDNYMLGSKEAAVKVILWLGSGPSSEKLFNTVYDLYSDNRDSMAIYFKFYPVSVPDMARLSALTCYKGEALAKGFKTVYSAAAGWGTPEHLKVFKEAGDPDVCHDGQVLEDIRTAAELRLPRHPVAFVNGTMLIEKLTKENIEKLANTRLN